VKKRSGRRNRPREMAPLHPGIREHYGTFWEPVAESSRKIDASRSMKFGGFVGDEDISAMEAEIGLGIPGDGRKNLRFGLDCAFTVLGVRQHNASAAPPHEIRDKMEQLRDSLHRGLAHLGVTLSDAESEKWEPSGLNFNPTVLTVLVDAANDDRELIHACTKAVGALARFADLARIKAEATIEKGEAASGVKRMACAQMLAAIFLETFGEAPTETKGGPWEKFACWFFHHAGAPITSNIARDMLREVKRSQVAGVPKRST
jgi:hypothetical protein